MYEWMCLYSTSSVTLLLRNYIYKRDKDVKGGHYSAVMYEREKAIETIEIGEHDQRRKRERGPRRSGD